MSVESSATPSPTPAGRDSNQCRSRLHWYRGRSAWSGPGPSMASQFTGVPSVHRAPALPSIVARSSSLRRMEGRTVASTPRADATSATDRLRTGWGPISTNVR